MRVAVTGTPGTGKTTATSQLDVGALPVDEIVHVNEVLERERLYDDVDDERGSLVVDLEALATWAADLDDVLFESHLAHHLEADRVAVLRCAPEVLVTRLRERGMAESSIEENAESEALDLVLAEAVDRHGTEAVYEIDTTDRSPAAVVTALEAVIEGRRAPSAGTVDFTGYLA